ASELLDERCREMLAFLQLDSRDQARAGEACQVVADGIGPPLHERRSIGLARVVAEECAHHVEERAFPVGPAPEQKEPRLIGIEPGERTTDDALQVTDECWIVMHDFAQEALP